MELENERWQELSQMLGPYPDSVILEWVKNNPPVSPYSTYRYFWVALMRNRISLLKALIAKFGWTKDHLRYNLPSILNSAIKKCSIGTINWLWDTFEINRFDIPNIGLLLSIAIEAHPLSEVTQLIGKLNLQRSNIGSYHLLVHTAIKEINIGTFKWLIKTFEEITPNYQNIRDWAHYAIIYNRPNILRWLFKKFQITKPHIGPSEMGALLLLTIREGNLDILQYLLMRFKLQPMDIYNDITDIYQTAAKVGSLNTLVLLTEHLQTQSSHFDGRVVRILRAALENNHLYVAHWLISQFRIYGRAFAEEWDSLLTSLIDRGNLYTLQWLFNHYEVSAGPILPHLKNLFRLAIEQDDFNYVRWLVDHFSLKRNCLDQPTLKSIVYSCASNGRLDILQWLTEKFNIVRSDFQDYVDNMTIFHSLAKNGRLEFFQWLTEEFDLRRRDFAGMVSHIEVARENGHDELATWLSNTFSAWNDFKSWILFQ